MLGETEKSSDVCRTASLSEMGDGQRAATSSAVPCLGIGPRAAIIAYRCELCCDCQQNGVQLVLSLYTLLLRVSTYVILD